ncbi:hypothetical protein AB0N89_03830 [Amycolatopsis sp. NPDC089917]|uniref:hypothetical protein n=1 Tax=Amycolatopsis sp. NPDC089917 TaxID=3155187 RepID=UPI00344495A2
MTTRARGALARILPHESDFSRFTIVTDVGGAESTLLTEILRARPRCAVRPQECPVEGCNVFSS